METKQTKTIYDLDLHEQLWINATLTVERIPGGWNYMYYSWFQETGWTLFQIVFVAYNNEFHFVPKSDF